MYGRAASILANIGLSYAKKYAPRVFGAAAAATTGYRFGHEMAVTQKRKFRSKGRKRSRAQSMRKAPVSNAKRVKKYPTRNGRPFPFEPNAQRRARTSFTENADNARAYHIVTQGRKLTSASLVKRATLSCMQRQLFFVRAYAPDTTAGGTFWNPLSHVLASSATRRDFPLYLYDLTGRPQFVGGSTQFPIACVRPYAATSGGNDGKIQWQTINHRDANNNDSVYWQVDEQSSASALQSYQTSLLSWIDLRMHIQGPRNTPGRIRVSVIQLLDDEYDPMPAGSLSVNGTTSIPHQVFWQSVIAGETVNPIHRITRPKKPGYRIIGEKTFETQPRESIDNDTRGQMHVLKWFMRLNHTANYNNAGFTFSNDTQLADTVLPANTSGNGVSPYCDSSKKIWLMVRSLAPTTITSDAVRALDSSVHGSFEINLRTCHQVLT